MLVNRKIASLRRKKGLSMEELADAAGIGRTTISRYESGKIKKIELDKLTKIADALDVSVDSLTEDDPVYESYTGRAPYEKRNGSVMVQDELDEDLLFSFHRLSPELRKNLVKTIHLIATDTN